MKIKQGDTFVRRYDGTVLRATLIGCGFAWMYDESHPSILPIMVSFEDLSDPELFSVPKKFKKAA